LFVLTYTQNSKYLSDYFNKFENTVNDNVSIIIRRNNEDFKVPFCGKIRFVLELNFTCKTFKYLFNHMFPLKYVISRVGNEITKSGALTASHLHICGPSAFARTRGGFFGQFQQMLSLSTKIQTATMEAVAEIFAIWQQWRITVRWAVHPSPAFVLLILFLKYKTTERLTDFLSR
jgi:ABC-type maltose transport system permease subunit